MPDKAQSRESATQQTLSAMLDDEAQELELRRVLRDLDRDPELRARWYRMQLARSALRGDAVEHVAGFAAAVRTAIDSEPDVQQAPARSWRRTLGSFAVAASVAAVVIVGGQQLAVTQGRQAAELARVAPIPVGVVNTPGAVPVQASFGTRPLPTLEPADRTAYRELARQRLRRYSQEHAAHAALNTPQGLLPFARVPEIEQ